EQQVFGTTQDRCWDVFIAELGSKLGKLGAGVTHGAHPWLDGLFKIGSAYCWLKTSVADPVCARPHTTGSGWLKWGPLDTAAFRGTCVPHRIRWQNQSRRGTAGRRWPPPMMHRRPASWPYWPGRRKADAHRTGGRPRNASDWRLRH